MSEYDANTWLSETERQRNAELRAQRVAAWNRQQMLLEQRQRRNGMIILSAFGLVCLIAWWFA